MLKSMLDYKRKNHTTPRLVIADAYTIGSNPFESKQAKRKSVYYITARKFLDSINPNLYSKKDTRYIHIGLAKIIDCLLYEPITMEEILETDKFLEFQKVTLNGLAKFEYPRELWVEIVEKYNGRIPITVKALPEGSVFYPNEPIIEIESSLENFGVLAAWFESSLLKVWAPTEMVTQLEHWVLYYIGVMDEIYGDSITKEQKDFFARGMLHNFGCRAGMTPQESEWLGEAALYSIPGTDTFSGAYQFWKNAGEEAGHSFSVSALAHRNIQSYDKEFECFEALFTYLKSGELGSNVADCNDFYFAVKAVDKESKKLIKGCLLELALRSKELGLNIVVVVRPDSGDAAKQLLFICDTAKEYGLFREIEINGKTWYGGTLLRFIEGDGMKWETMKQINDILLSNNYLVWEWGLYGMGGGMRNDLSRDHASTKYALCAVGEDLRPVVKFSETAGKSTLPGPFKLLRNKEALESGVTIVHASEQGEDARVIYYDGLNFQFFGNTMFEDNRDTKKRIREQMATMPKRLKNDIPASDFIINKRIELLKEYAPEKVEFFTK